MPARGHQKYGLFGPESRFEAETLRKLAVARKGKPSNNPTGKGRKDGVPAIPKERMRRAVRRVMLRVCAKCKYYTEHMTAVHREERIAQLEAEARKRRDAKQ